MKFNDIRHKIADVVATGTATFGLTQHEVVIGGAGGILGQVPSLGAAGQVLTSNGAGADPSWQAGGGGVSTGQVWLSGLEFPTALGYTVLAESFPRFLCTAASAGTSSQERMTAIAMPAGLTLSRMTMFTGTTSETGGTHGWYGICDVSGVLKAVTADQVGATTWAPTESPITLPFTASYTTTYTGVYYLVVSITASGQPNLCGLSSGAIPGAFNTAPNLGGAGALQQTPPALGTTLTPGTGAVLALYGCVG